MPNVGMEIPIVEPIQQNHQMVSQPQPQPQPMNTSENLSFSESDFESLLNSNLAETDDSMQQSTTPVNAPPELRITPVANTMKNTLDLLFMDSQQESHNFQQN